MRRWAKEQTTPPSRDTTSIGGGCDDHVGDPCLDNGECADSCDEQGRVCADARGAPCRDDGNPCTDNHCDGDGACVVSANSVACDDGDPCTAGDRCEGGGCRGSSVCGDGLLQAACGEVCDDGGETVGCNADCTLASCGDAFVNAAAGEQCDDGNLVAGDGCNSQCQVEEVCADHDRSGRVAATDALIVLRNVIGLRDQPLRCPDAPACDGTAP